MITLYIKYVKLFICQFIHFWGTCQDRIKTLNCLKIAICIGYVGGIAGRKILN